MKIHFLEFKSLEELEPVTGIVSSDEQFYLVSAKNSQVHVADKNWKVSETLSIDDTPQDAASDSLEDEACVIVRDNKQPALLILKSGKGENNNYGYLMNLKSRAVEKIDLSVFYNRMRQAGLADLNLQSAVVINDKIVLCNRAADKLDNENRLIFISGDFWKKQATADIFKAKIEWEQLPDLKLTITALTYSYENDWLILTATADKKSGERESGAVVDCYMGVVENAFRKSDRKRIRINESFNLSDLDPVLENQAIESLCLQADKEKKLKLHLVSKDSSGEYYLLKLRLKS
ncbi:MAG: hypothetical protein ABI151_14355 [Chitinophagaceae bacterium]